HSNSCGLATIPPTPPTPTRTYPLSLHDALPISGAAVVGVSPTILAAKIRVADTAQREAISAALRQDPAIAAVTRDLGAMPPRSRSEEHTSEVQSLAYLVCRLLRVKKKLGRGDPS